MHNILKPNHLKLEQHQISFFKKNGYLILDNFLKKEECEKLKNKINSVFIEVKEIKVTFKKTKFRTINGPIVDNNIPELSDLYDKKVHSLLSSIEKELTTLDNRKIGLSINKTSNDEKFQAHFDRNLITAVIYLDSDIIGGEMKIHPRIRLLINLEKRKVYKEKVQRLLDRIVKFSLYQKIFSKFVRITPKSGRVLIFEGFRTLHEVEEVLDGERISIQLAYDKPGKIYHSAEYYGDV